MWENKKKLFAKEKNSEMATYLIYSEVNKHRIILNTLQKWKKIQKDKKTRKNYINNNFNVTAPFEQHTAIIDMPTMKLRQLLKREAHN